MIRRLLLFFIFLITASIYSHAQCVTPCTYTVDIGPSGTQQDTTLCGTTTFFSDGTDASLPACVTYTWYKKGSPNTVVSNTAILTTNTEGQYWLDITAGTCTKSDTVNVIFPVSTGKEASNWNFGTNASISFNTSPPTSATGSALSYQEGSSSISDASGNLLFYTDGRTVWNKNNAVMPAGTGLNGGASATQPALIVPFPGDASKYYIFTTPSPDGVASMNYSVVDMSLNGGLGDVTTLNSAFTALPTTDNVIAIGHSNGSDIWVITHGYNNNTFIADQVSSSGVSAAPVVSNAGTVPGLLPDNTGYLKASHDGTKLAYAFTNLDQVEIYDFDPATGIVSNPIILSGISIAYGVEFSPDNSKLYVGTKNGGQLLQYDVSSNDQATINASKVLILGSVPSTYFTDIQTGPDGKLYVSKGKAGSNFLGVINNPDASGTACNFVNLGLDLGTGSAKFGLPDFVRNYYANTSTFTYADTCAGTGTLFTSVTSGSPISWNWDFGDGNTGTGPNPTHIYSAAGPYTVTLTVPNSCGGTTIVSKTLTINPSPVVDLKDTLLCVAPYLMDAGNPGAAYLWSTGATTQTISVTAGGYYWARVTKNGCSNADTARISFWGQGNKGDYQWYFGNNGGLDFSTSPPQAVSGNQINTGEGSSSISDPLGNLLFYTDGVTVWNKSNAVMANGTGLKGQSGSTQSSLIVPNPGANNIYYVFTVSPVDGLNYSVVDLSANGGLGTVSQKNISLFTPSTEKLTGVKDDNGDFWVVSHDLNSNQIRAYKVDKTGVASAPVISALGTVETSGDGYMKFSSDGTKAAVAVKGQNLVEVYDFDQATGVFSNPVTISNATTPYGIEFAPDNSYLYVSTNGNGEVLQYDLNAGSPAAINSSKVVISNDNTISYNAMQLAPDGRIYISDGVTGSGFLGVINNPSFDSSQVAFQAKPISLGGGQSNSGLPNFVSNYYSFSDWGIIDQDTCFGDLTLFQGSAPDTVRTWTWDFGDPSSGMSNTASGQTVSHTFSASGTYTVTLVVIHHCGTKTLTKQVTVNPLPSVNLGNDTTLCSATSIQLDAGSTPPGSTYNWNTNVHTQKITATATGQYYVDVINGGCTSTDTINLAFLNAGSLNLGNDTTLCIGQSLTLNTGAFPGATITWNDASNLQTLAVNVTGKYYVDITYTGCKITDTINVSFVSPPTASLGPDLTLCSGTTAKIGSHNNTATYLWNTSATTDSISVNAAGKYWVNIFFGGCGATDSINVTFVVPGTLNLGNDTTLCNGQSLTLNTGSHPGASIKWNNASTLQTLVVNATGKYYADVTCQVTDTIKVTFVSPPVVALGADFSLCAGSVKKIGSNNTGATYLWNTLANTDSITVNSAGTYWLDVFFGGCKATDTINVGSLNLASLNLGNDTILCTGQSFTLNTGSYPGATITWNDGSHLQTLTVNTTNKYFVDITFTGCKITDTINVSFVSPPTASLGIDLNLCQGVSKKIGSHNNTATYRWNTLAGTDSITVNSAGKYWIDIFFGGCKATDTIDVTVTPRPSVNLGPNQTLCIGSSVTLNALNPALSHAWSDASNGQTLTTASTGIYWVDVSDEPCTVRDSVTLTFIPPPALNLGNDTILCTGADILLDATNAGFSYLWNDNSNSAQLTVSAAGKYYASVFQGNCAASDTINITYETGPSISLPAEKIFCSEDQPYITLYAGSASSYLWMPNGETTDSIRVSAAGTYTLEAKSPAACISIASINVLDICEATLYVPKAFTPNGDGNNDEFQIFGMNITEFEINIFNQWGELIFISNDMSKSWDGKYRDKVVVDGAYAWKIKYSGQTRNGIITKTKVGDVTVLK
jgi:gliding motility-associated-like protein